MKSRNLVVAALGGVLVIAVWYMMLFSPMRKDTSKVKEETSATEGEVEVAMAQLAQLKDVQSRSKDIEAQLTKLQAAVPANPALSQFLTAANKIAETSGVEWQSVTPGTPAAGLAGMTSIPLGITVVGDVHQVTEYLNQLLDLPRLVVVDGVNIGTSEDTGTTGGAVQSTDGPPTGDIFAGHGAPPKISLEITGRMFMASPVVTDPTAAGATTGTPAATPGATPS